jgi:hypothetical protein
MYRSDDMSQEKTGELFAKQLEIDKHFKMKCDAGQLDIHAGPTCLGLWMVSKDCPGDSNSIGMICEKGRVYFQMWPDKSFYNKNTERNRLPFAFSSSSGLQVPHPDGTVTTISLNELSDLVKNLKK